MNLWWFWRHVSAPFGHGFATPTFQTHTRLVTTNSFCMLDITQASSSAIKADNSKFHVVLVTMWFGGHGGALGSHERAMVGSRVADI